MFNYYSDSLLDRKLRKMADKTERDGVEIERLVKKHKRIWYVFRVFGTLVVFALIVRVTWFLVETYSEWIEKPGLCKVSILVAAISAWVAIICRKKVIAVILFIFAALGALYAAWVALLG